MTHHSCTLVSKEPGVSKYISQNNLIINVDIIPTNQAISSLINACHGTIQAIMIVSRTKNTMSSSWEQD